MSKNNGIYVEKDYFVSRHIGPSKKDLNMMLEVLDIDTLDSLVEETFPSEILLDEQLNLPEEMTEDSYLKYVKKLASKNQIFKSYIGLGYYGCITPGVILRNIFENPGWYTQYTPYQAEISQGRLEALLNFQTMVCDLTKMDVANASLLDEGTAAAEAMTMLYRVRSKEKIKSNATSFFVSDGCFPQTIDILKTRAAPLGIKIVIGNENEISLDESFYGAIVQYPDKDGMVNDYSKFMENVHVKNINVVVAADILSLTLLTPPGEFGADVVVGNTQRFGVPMGFGGPHAAYFATKQEFMRQIPGRIIGVSVDKRGNSAYRMSLQTREQHIRREKATSNICTAQSLLAIMASMYAVYHGPQGLKNISTRVNKLTEMLNYTLSNMGVNQLNKYFFDTLLFDLKDFDDDLFKNVELEAIRHKLNFRYDRDNKRISISLDETTTTEDLKTIIDIFSEALKLDNSTSELKHFSPKIRNIPETLLRTSSYLDHPVFNTNSSETSMLRYIKMLESRDLSLAQSMIPLGSCTMKLNSTSEMIPVSWEEFSNLHPFCPLDQASGYLQIIEELEKFLCEITGFSSCSLQPNSGAQGEYAGLLVIREYFKNKGQEQRNVVLVPSSAHGTNPATATMVGMKVVVVKCKVNGDIDIDDLKQKCEKQAENIAAIMVTYPSTHGVFETGIKEICEIVHNCGGQVYMDGANLNAQVGLSKPALIGADVCHINLHKTFSIPHGGGGPGMGPICVSKHLSPYLPGHSIVSEINHEKSDISISSAPWGSASILLISYGYIRMLGSKGVTDATKYAILNANYLKSRLEPYFTILYQGVNSRVAHEFILDLRFLKTLNLTVEDIAKRLIDYGFHAPTMSWPVPGTLMIEPTESESKAELDRFCDAMIKIHNEIEELSNGEYDKSNNVLINSPHTVFDLVSDKWDKPYTRKKACFPAEYLKENKFWPHVSRIDNAYGDKNLVCTCPPLEAYEED